MVHSAYAKSNMLSAIFKKADILYNTDILTQATKRKKIDWFHHKDDSLNISEPIGGALFQFMLPCKLRS